MSSNSKFARRECSVYDGRELIGRYVQTAPKAFVAHDARGRRLDQFAKERDAYRAIGAALKNGGSR